MARLLMVCTVVIGLCVKPAMSTEVQECMVDGDGRPFLDACLRTCDKKRKTFDDPKAPPDELASDARCEAFKCHSYCALKTGCIKFWEPDCNATVGLYHAQGMLKDCDVDCSIAMRTCPLGAAVIAVLLSIVAVLHERKGI
eukprot:gnl/TRDRNA2_/TRDRNA2_167472_c0_seq3.p1 gnl/TRDRNA2_/TRDRNA2_167472_c0~~gnl/TRDRNA2_/TRDRNA2_167472_c0_seq3.p1  ORF type:complete len:141 (+),score=21.89 gnl/TRDRNA2_/TRDRNA2_167472_c0_seq3:92-514(+)